MRPRPRRWWSVRRPSARVERQLVLADLQLVAVLEAVGLDPLAVDVRAVQRAAVVDVPLVAAADQQGGVAGGGGVVGEDLGVGPAADAQWPARHREAPPPPPPPAAAPRR